MLSPTFIRPLAPLRATRLLGFTASRLVMQISSIWLARLARAALQNCLNGNYNHADNASWPRPRPLRREFVRPIIRSGDNFADIVAKKFRGPECAGNASEPLHKKLIKSDGKDEQELLSRRAGLFPYIHTSKIGGGIKMQEWQGQTMGCQIVEIHFFPHTAFCSAPEYRYRYWGQIID